MNKGNCSFFPRSARFSSGRGRISIYLETSSPPLRSPITFRPPQSIPFSSTSLANFTIDSTNFNPWTEGSLKAWSTSSRGSLLVTPAGHYMDRILGCGPAGRRPGRGRGPLGKCSSCDGVEPVMMRLAARGRPPGTAADSLSRSGTRDSDAAGSEPGPGQV
jgi:hypothetical protein